MTYDIGNTGPGLGQTQKGYHYIRNVSILAKSWEWQYLPISKLQLTLVKVKGGNLDRSPWLAKIIIQCIYIYRNH